MKIKTRECSRHYRDWGGSFWGHAPHAYTAIGLTGRRAYRCPRRAAIEIPPSHEQLMLDEMRKIRRLLEDKEVR